MQLDHNDDFHVPGGGPYLLTHPISCLPLRTEAEAIQTILGCSIDPDVFGVLQARFDCRGPVLRLSFHLCNSVEDAILTGQAWSQ